MMWKWVTHLALQVSLPPWHTAVAWPALLSHRATVHESRHTEQPWDREKPEHPPHPTPVHPPDFTGALLYAKLTVTIRSWLTAWFSSKKQKFWSQDRSYSFIQWVRYEIFPSVSSLILMGIMATQCTQAIWLLSEYIQGPGHTDVSHKDF